MLFSRSVISDSATPWLQHARLPCPSLSPRVCLNLCHPTISSSVTPFSYCPPSFPASESFQIESALCIRWPKYWSFSFSINPSKDWLVWSPYCPGYSQESSLAPQFKSINSLAFCLLYGLALTIVPDCWQDHSFDYMDLCRKSDIFAFLTHCLGLS